MIHEPTTQDILEAINTFASHIDDQFALMVTKEEFADGMAEVVAKEEFKETLANLATKDELAVGLANMITKDEFTAGLANTVTKEHLEQTLTSRMANLATKEEVTSQIIDLRAEMRVNFADIREQMATKHDLRVLKQDLLTEIDHFANSHRKFDHELSSLHTRVDRIEAHPALNS